MEGHSSHTSSGATGSDGHDHHHTRRKHSGANRAAATSFEKIAEGRSSLKQSDFERLLGEKIGPLLWKNVFGDRDEVNQEAFSRHYYELSDIRTTQCTNMFSSVEEFLDACLSTSGKSLKDEKSKFVSSLVQYAKKEGSAHFFESHCPSLAKNTIIRHIQHVFCPSPEQVIFAVDSKICSPLQMFLIQGSLSEMVYFRNKQATQPCWHKIYESRSQGLTTNRFEAKVFGYPAPSVAIFKLTNGEIYSIANNTEWRHTTEYLGSSLTKCVQLVPHFKIIESRHEEPIMCNFKYRTAPYGIGFRDVFTVNGDFDNVDSIEVWSCGGQASMEDMQSLKQRQEETNRQLEETNRQLEETNRKLEEINSKLNSSTRLSWIFYVTGIIASLLIGVFFTYVTVRVDIHSMILGVGQSIEIKSSGKSLCTFRVVNEVNEIISSRDLNEQGVLIEVLANNLQHLQGYVRGPPNSPYANSTFVLEFKVPDAYPFKPPVVKFVTKILHPNVSSVTGSIYLDVLKENWAASMTLRTILLSIQALLTLPEPNDPQDAVVASQYLKDRSLFNRTATFWSQYFAGANNKKDEIFLERINKMQDMGLDEEDAIVKLSNNQWDLNKTKKFSVPKSGL